MDDITTRLQREAQREPHEPIWLDAIAEIERLRRALRGMLHLEEESGGFCDDDDDLSYEICQAYAALMPNEKVEGASDDN